MKLRNLIRVLLILFMVILAFLGVYALFLNPTYNSSYLKAIKSKREKLIMVSSPKIVISGDENVNYGVDSHQMELALGLPVVNMGLNATIGTEKILRYVKADLKNGDILLLSLDYGLLSDLGWNGRDAAETLAQNEGYIMEMFVNDNLKDEFLSGNFNKEVSKSEIEAIFPQDRIAWLKEQKKHFTEKGIAFFLVPPMVIMERNDQAKAQKFWQHLSTETGIPLLGDVKDHLYPKAFFSDSIKPNIKGRKVRTAALIADIQETKLLNNEVVRLVPENKPENLMNISDFNDHSGIEILKRDKNQLVFKVVKSPNYLRFKKKGVDYTGYSFAIELNCSEQQFRLIKFKGVTRKSFDESKITGDVFEGYMEDLKEVYFKDGHSYVGISVGDTIDFEHTPITINTVIMNKIPIWHDSFSNAALSFSPAPASEFNFVVSSPDKRFALSDIFSFHGELNLRLRTNEIYKIVTTDREIFLKHFHSGINIYKLELLEDFRLKGYTDGIVTVFSSRQNKTTKY